MQYSASAACAAACCCCATLTRCRSRLASATRRWLSVRRCLSCCTSASSAACRSSADWFRALRSRVAAACSSCACLS
eukprot:5507884-Prymnesium_polylepis.1